jgi:glyoxylase-like metal-dependent hydrolase (beta-lactamase superfamily II)
VHPFPEFTTFQEGERFNWGEDYVAIHTPGHADGHMIFYSSESGTVLAGDLLLPKITPNVGYFPGFNSNPLQAFFDSLNKLQQYKLEMVLPGHRDVYNNGNKRIIELIGHHQIRLEETLVFLEETSTAQEVSDKLFPRLTLDSDPLQLLFALQETLAHLIYLREEGLLKSQTDDKGVTRFSLVKPR